MLKKTIQQAKEGSPLTLQWWDWLLFAFFAVACFFLFNQKDIEITVDVSYQLLHGNVFNFYSSATEWWGHSGGSVYLPPTYIIFAIWNIPIFLLGKAPVLIYSSSALKMVWYKLLTVIVYLIAGLIIRKICQSSLGFSNNKAKLAMYLFYTAPLAFFSQFIFGQYDVFTVALMLLGLHYYLKADASTRDHWLFVLFFGLAATFKYYVLAVFFVLLVLRNKQILRLLGSAGLVFVPIVLISLPFAVCDFEAFRASVMNFHVLGYTNVAEIPVGASSIRLQLAALLALFVWAYFVKPKDRKNFISYAFFFGSGVIAALFVFMPWHPQWLMIGAPIWAMSLLQCRHRAVLLWTETIFSIPFFIYVVNRFPNNVDQDMLKRMVFTPWLRGSETEGALMMRDIYPSVDLSLLFTIMVALFILWFVLRHPCFSENDPELDVSNTAINFEPLTMRIAMRARIIVPVLFFVIPALMCLPSLLAAAGG